MQGRNPRNDSVAFFALTALLSLPFYAMNALAQLSVVGEPAMGGLYIATFTFTPVASASILTLRRRGSRGVKELLRRVFDFEKVASRRWYAAVLLPPVLSLLSLAVLSMVGAPIAPALTPLAALPVVFLFCFLLAAGEEAGWMGYAFESIEKRGALRAALVLGVVWASWHVPFFVFLIPDPVALGAQIVTLVGIRVLVVWIFINTGRSVFMAVLFHAADNTALLALPEVNFTRWGEVVHCGLVLAAAVVVTVLWGPRTLARFSHRDWR